MSWASIAKRNIPPPTATESTVPTPRKDVVKVPDTFAQELFTSSVERNRQSVAELEKEHQQQRRPSYIGLKRPDAPTAFPIFKTTEEEWAWMRAEDAKNNAYSAQVFEERMQKWRIKHNWQLPPMKTTVTPDEMRKGFYIAASGNGSDSRGNTEVRYITPYSTNSTLSGDLSDELTEMMWCLVHSRSDELVACNTVADFKALFERTIHLEPDLHHLQIYTRRKDRMPMKLLWLFSQKANVFPGKARPGTAHWTRDPVMKPSDYAFRQPPWFDAKTYTKSMVFFSLLVCRDSTTNAIVIGKPGGREESGLCIVERLKHDGDAAKIRWLLSANQLREMERVIFWPECSPFRESIDNGDDYYSDD
jgi:hypothetical protein